MPAAEMVVLMGSATLLSVKAVLLLAKIKAINLLDVWMSMDPDMVGLVPPPVLSK